MNAIDSMKKPVVTDLLKRGATQHFETSNQSEYQLVSCLVRRGWLSGIFVPDTDADGKFIEVKLTFLGWITLVLLSAKLI